jgi:hypothetical protein
MKFAVLIAIIVITIIYLKYYNDKKNEHFIGYNINDTNVFYEKDNKSNKKDNHDRITKYDAIKNMNTSMYIEGRSSILPGLEENYSSAFSNKPWVVKGAGFSDIFNYEDDNIDPSLKITNLTPGAGEIKNPIKKKEIKKDSKVPLFMVHKNKKYNYFGIATNRYYEQYYLVYEYNTTISNNETPFLRENSEFMKDGLYEYILVKKEDTKSTLISDDDQKLRVNTNEIKKSLSQKIVHFKVIHEVNPRTRINYGDIVYFSYGSFELGPLIIENIKIN